ncbi:hypothetical protein ACIRVF_33870 [Kitasatospora sp. NPDC101157]|uniref:hypothetical protein n=1 Tax=Kitasatospora sp. NPDC101157 TaxID=3364098 RepID=UPI003827FEC6
MRKGLKALAVAALAIGTLALTAESASADSYSQYQGGVRSVSYGRCTALMDGAYDDTLGYWVARGAFSMTGGDGDGQCFGALYRKKDGSSTWTQVSYDIAASAYPNWNRTAYHWDGPGAESKVCITWGIGRIDEGLCSDPW